MFTLYSHARRDSNSSSEEDESPLHPSGSSRVKRALFGPTDHEENLRFVKNELKKARNEASSRWNFDFDSGKPLNGAFEWEEVASSTAGVTVCNPEKHSFKSSSVSEEDSEEHFFKSSSGCDESEAAKENRVGGHSAGDLGQCPRESRLSEERGGATEDGGGGGGGAGCDLRTQPPASVTPPTPAAAASQSQPSSSHLGARPKELTEAKERKLTGKTTITIYSGLLSKPLSNLFIKLPRTHLTALSVQVTSGIKSVHRTMPCK